MGWLKGKKLGCSGILAIVLRMLERNKRKIKLFLQTVLYVCFSNLIFHAYISNKNT